MNLIYLQETFWFAFICYAVPLLIYISKLHHYIEINDLLQLLNYSVLACAFLAFSVYTFKNALDKSIKKTDLEDTSTLYKSPARLGYGLMVLNFIIIIILAWRNGEPLYFQRIIGLAGYLCLALKLDYGIFLIIAFYILSLWLAVKTTYIDIIYAISKFGLLLYFSLYGYRYVTLQGRIGEKIRQKLEK